MTYLPNATHLAIFGVARDPFRPKSPCNSLLFLVLCYQSVQQPDLPAD